MVEVSHYRSSPIFPFDNVDDPRLRWDCFDRFLDPVRTSDTKYTGNWYFAVLSLCLISFSTTRALLTAECVAGTYKMWGCPYSRLDSVCKCSGYCFRSSKACCCSAPQSTFVEPRNVLKKGRLFSASFAMNLLSAAMRPINFCTSFLVCGGCIWMIALILSGMFSIPLVETKQPPCLLLS
jgi:hypothetical protein